MSTLNRLYDLYDVLNYRNALGVLQTGSPRELEELLDAFVTIRLHISDLTTGGGNESNIPKKFSGLLKNEGWQETRISGELLVKLQAKKIQGRGYDERELTIEKFLDGHKIDYVKIRHLIGIYMLSQLSTKQI